jgi:hypothetical protein
MGGTERKNERTKDAKKWLKWELPYHETKK